MEEEQKQRITPADVSKRWGIPYIVNTDEVKAISAWQMTFIQLGNATMILRDAEKQINNMAKVIAGSLSEIEIYERALAHACQVANIDRDELLQKVLASIQNEQSEPPPKAGA